MSCYVGGRCLVHTTSGEVLHSLQPNFQRGQMQCVHPHHAKITSQGHVVLLYADHTGVVASFTNGGKQLACKMLPEQALVSPTTTITVIAVLANTFYCIFCTVFSAHYLRS